VNFDTIIRDGRWFDGSGGLWAPATEDEPALGPLARVVDKLGGDFRWQHLPVPFEVYADGIDLVIFEEFGPGAATLHLKEYGPRVWHRDFFDAGAHLRNMAF
jgi:N-acyl-D-aspartate/D-glutamate deacylase